MPDASRATRARVVSAQINHERLDLEELRRSVQDPAAGAVAEFLGAVRDHDHGRAVRALHYTAHPSADEVLASVVTEVATSATGVRAVAVAHRVGDLTVGDVAFAVVVSADHRHAAFSTCARLVDEVKASLPVWKHQWFDDGSDEWVGSA